MTSMPATVQRFTHTHLLTKSDSVYICDGCGTYGSGKTYRCKPCNYYLHEFCATCPFTLPAVFIHPQHELSLYKRKEQSTSQDGRVCDICNESVEGFFYRCEICDFDAHPYCTQFPQNVKHPIHSAHTLKFCLAEASECNICHDSCQSWRYRCELCNYDIHVKCIMPKTAPSDQEESCNTTRRDLTQASSTNSDGDVCKDCGSKNSVKRNQCKACRDLKWERRIKRLENVKKVLEVVSGFFGP